MENTVINKSKLCQKINWIINADDLGICKERDDGIFELFNKGFISSSSILVNSDNFESSVNRAQNENMF